MAFCLGWQLLGLLALCRVGRVRVYVCVCDVPLGMVGSQVPPKSCFYFSLLNPSPHSPSSSSSLTSRLTFSTHPGLSSPWAQAYQRGVSLLLGPGAGWGLGNSLEGQVPQHLL